MNVFINFIKREKLVSFVLYLLFCIIGSRGAIAQNTCGTPHDKNDVHRSTETSRTSATCSQTVYVKVNFHFMLKSDGTGNFTEYDDGMGNTNYNGYMYAQDLVNGANSNLINNQQTRLPIGNTVPIPTMNLRYIIGGIYFHRDDAHYTYQQSGNIHNTYGIDKTTEINAYFSYLYHPSGVVRAGCAAGVNPISTDRWIRLTSPWQSYFNGYGVWGFIALFNHEIGHLLGLDHTFSNAETCADTYTSGTGTSGIWSGPGSDNNMMDYNEDQRAVTPCQWGIMQYQLENSYLNYTTCCSSPPATAVFSLRSNACIGDAIYLDGSWRYTKSEQNYAIEIYQTNAVGSNTNMANYYSQSFSGQYGKINLSSLYTFSTGNIYRVKLTATGTNCTSTDSDIRWITIQNDVAYLQNSTITSSNDYFSKCHYRIGNHVDGGSTSGDVTISSPAVVNLKAGRTISLEVGTTINSGAQATFNISPYAYSFANIAYRTDATDAINGTEGNETSSSSPSIQFFPNPSKGTSSIVLNYKESKSVNLSILNSMGEEIYAQDLGAIKEHRVDVDLTNKPNGFYIIKVKANEETESLKFILSK
ncbi:MAG: T9SS type A sorting domain-containing protein [Cytophagaceae bacterium]|nr:T9SS type A sorting domain-containing protein [Cytophagaceae bacterium]